MKKFSFMFLCSMLMMFAAATTAVAQTGGEFGDGLAWEAVDGALTITGNGAMPDFVFAGEQPWVDIRTSITTVTVGDGITHIGNCAFQYFTQLADITIGSSVTSIGTDIFTNCMNLTSVELPELLTTIGNFAFSNSGITSVVIPDAVTSIGARAFLNCTSMTSVTIGSLLADIGVYCFANCTALTEVVNRATAPQTIAAEHFANVTIASATLKVPAEALDAYQDADVWTDFGTIMAISDGETYTIEATANPAEGGEVSGTGNYGAGTQATLTATPASGYEFVNWTENDVQVSDEAEYVFTVTSARTLVANFALKTWNVSVVASPDEGGNVTGEGTYTHDESATVTATASNGYEFVKWTENGMDVSIHPEYTFSVRNNRNLTANFELKTYTIAVSATAGGTVTGGGDYTTGTSITITATPAANYTFANWTENDIEVENAAAEYSFTVTGDRTLVANFALQQFEVTFNMPENGTLTVTAGSETVANGSMVNYNTELVITATPDEGYKPESLTVNGENFANGSTYLVDSDTYVECIFTQDVGIDDNTLANITVYGNEGSVYIVNKNNINLKLVQILDVLGRVVYSGQAGGSVTIPVNGASGIYVVQLVSDNGKTSSTKVHLDN